jgi:hypothetical protein
MPLAGTTAVLAASIKAKRLAKLDPSQRVDNAAMAADSEAIAEAVIEHFLANAAIAAGIPVSTTGTAAAQTGATTAPGVLV